MIKLRSHVIILQMKKEKERALCVFWAGSSWSNEGCQVISSDKNQTVCSCNHLSSFAILMASTELMVISTLGKVTLTEMDH